MGRRRHPLRALRAAILGLAVAALLAGPAVSGARGAQAVPAPATFTVRIDAGGRGTFTVRGGLSDQGRAAVRRAVAGGRLNATVTLTGSMGRIVLTSRRSCATGAGTWRVVAGTLAYAKLAGGGALAGRTRCARPLGPATVVFRGTVELPPALLAPPGAYGGRTAQGSAFTFEVTSGGRSVGKVLLGGFRYDCLRSDGLRSSGSSGVDSTFAGPFPIAVDGTFSFKGGAMTLSGRFTATGAQGTIAIDVTYPADAQGRTTACSGSTSWTATTPAPPPKRALAGTYCGFSLGGGGVCMDVTADGQVRAVRAESKLTCGVVARIPVTVTIASELALPLRTDLSFRGSFAQPFEGRTIQAAISGTFDERGGLTGVVGPSQLTITRDGVQHICRGNGNFTATLQR